MFNDHITRRILNASLLLALFASFFINPIPALADGSRNAILPNFADFSQSVQNGESGLLRGVYIPNLLAMPVLQQPAGNAGYVSTSPGKVTQFSLASKYGNVGLLAHNYLAGKLFAELAPGQEVRLVYGDGQVEKFVVTEVLHYQALQPSSRWSSFRNTDKDEALTVEQMFKRVYFGAHHLTFQTCIEKDGNLSWGRLFVIAIPVSTNDKLSKINN